jgi:mannose-6-phosphate isomerase-like protein (cupin superfamily)
LHVHYANLEEREIQDGVRAVDILSPTKTTNGNAGLRLLSLQPERSYDSEFENLEVCYYLLNGRGSLGFPKTGGQSKWVVESDTAMWVPPGMKHTIINSGEGPFRLLVAYCTPNRGERGQKRVVKISDLPVCEMIGFRSRSIFSPEVLDKLGASRCIGVDLETLTPLSVLDTHAHEEEILFVLRGKGFVMIGDDKFEVVPGSTVYTGPHLPHSVHNTAQDNLQYLVFEYSP